MPSWYHSSHNSYEYNKQTKQKVATFYHPNSKSYYDGIQNELETIDKLENHVAEVAISFDKAYRYSQIKTMMPENVNVVWLYLFPEEKNETNGPSGTTTYGFELNRDDENKIITAENDKNTFFETFEYYTSPMKQKKITSFIKTNKDKTIEDLPILGVMVTGQTKNLSQLKDKSFIRGSSIGATSPIVPYITPEK